MGVRRLCILIATLAWLSVPDAWGQELEPTPAVARAPEPEVVHVPQIPERTESLQKALRRITASAAVEPAITAIESELPEIREQGALRLVQTESLLDESPTLDQLHDSEAGWTSRLTALASRRRTVAHRASLLEEEVSELGTVANGSVQSTARRTAKGSRQCRCQRPELCGANPYISQLLLEAT